MNTMNPSSLQLACRACRIDAAAVVVVVILVRDAMNLGAPTGVPVS